MAKAAEKFSDFKEVITSFYEIYEIMGSPLTQVLGKVIDHLDDVCLSHIAASPFYQIATVHGDGPIDISPKGDPAGFVQVLNGHHLAIPNRPGNRRVDKFRNLLCGLRVGLFFLVPDTGETLRVSGEACIVRDQALRHLPLWSMSNVPLSIALNASHTRSCGNPMPGQSMTTCLVSVPL